jgi:hypothetical protein
MGSYIDNVRCGNCDAGLMLEASIVTIQNYREQPTVRHFWVYCSFCATHKLYWPTVRQIVLADVLDCRTVTAEVLPDEIMASYRRDSSVPPDRIQAPIDPTAEVAFLLNMLAATSGLDQATSQQECYLPSHWSN